MSFIEKVASLESKLRPMILNLPHNLVVNLYSTGRKEFLNYLIKSPPDTKVEVGDCHKLKLWDLEFNSPIFNAAGMFKTGDGYELCQRQGAGAFLAGTSTFLPRAGNIKSGITHPFIPLPKSNASINWMGLPNEGYQSLAKRLSKIDKMIGCPVGASISPDPLQTGKEAMFGVLSGLEILDIANVDFIELNESCPNVPHELGKSDTSGLDSSLVKRIEFVSDKFLKMRKRNLPVIIKLSNDTDITLLPQLIDLLIEVGFDGINFGNTSTKYFDKSEGICSTEKLLFDYFTQTFGGGISGEPLKKDSLALSSEAYRILRDRILKNEFHIIRTGGVMNYNDIQESADQGIQLNQWFTGYFESFAKYGNNIYQHLLNNS